MGDSLPTVWTLEAHTEAKHRILQGYLDGWFPILGSIRRAERVLYVDGFAGPGEYSKQEPGSPLIALRAAIKSAFRFNTTVRLVFIENDDRRHTHLCEILERHKSTYANIHNLEIKTPIKADCETALLSVLDKYEQKSKQFGPALLFLDQFGYSDISLDFIARVMAHSQCEIFSYLHADGIRRFLSDETKHKALSRAFGTDAWREALSLPPRDNLLFLAELYQRQIKSQGNSSHTWKFAMFDKSGKLLYWLFFCTNNRKGMEVMKRAMSRVDDSGGEFRFSDSTAPGQILAFSSATSEWLQNHLQQSFAGQTVSVDDIELHVLDNTPAIAFKKELGILERSGIIHAVNPPRSRRTCSFKDPKMVIQFK